MGCLEAERSHTGPKGRGYPSYNKHEEKEKGKEITAKQCSSAYTSETKTPFYI